MKAGCPRGIDERSVLFFQPIDGAVTLGHAWGSGARFPGSGPHAYVYVPRSPVFPHYPPALTRPGAPRPGWTVELRTLEESLLYVTAHELGHLRYGPSERPAHAWGMRALRRYRRRGLPIPMRLPAEATESG